MENVTQEPASHGANMKQELPQCKNMLWFDGREREVEYLEYYKERWNWKLSLPPGSIMRSMPKLLLIAMSGSMSMPQKRWLLTSVPHITTTGHGDIPCEAASGPNRMSRVSAQLATPHWMRYSEKLTLYLTMGSIWDSRPCT